MNNPHIDPRILEHSRQMAAEKARKQRRQWLKDNTFNLINSVLAFLALIISIFGLFLPAR